MFSPQNILVPTDFSVYSDKALATALDIAEKFHSRVYLLHVIDHPVVQVTADYYLPDEVVSRMEDDALRRSLEQMDQEIAKIAAERHVDIVRDVKRGSPCDEILKEQAEKDIELTIMPGHVKSGIIDYLLGNTAERVAKHAKTPVLMI